MRKETITIKVEPWSEVQDVTVEAERFGPFAIHRTYALVSQLSKARFTLTHVQSGMYVRQNISKAAALRLAKALCSAKLDWNFSTLRNVPLRTNERAKAIIIRLTKGLQ